MASMTARTDKDEAPRLTKWEWTRVARKQPREALSSLARHTLQTLAEYADPNGSNCRPSYQSLADDMGRCRSQAGEGVKELVARGWVERRAITVHGRRATLFVPLIPASAGVASSGPPDDGPAVETGASSGPPDGTCPAHRTQPDQDQIKEKTPGYFDEDPLTVEEQMIENAQFVAVRSACELGCTPERWWNSSRRHRDELVLRLAERLRAGQDPLALLDGLVAKKPPRNGVDQWPHFLLGRLGKLQSVPSERRASA